MFEKTEDKRKKRPGLAHFLENSKEFFCNLVKYFHRFNFFLRRLQCDQLARLFNQYLAIFKIQNLPDSIKNFVD